jgi:hypothetical protein
MVGGLDHHSQRSIYSAEERRQLDRIGRVVRVSRRLGA